MWQAARWDERSTQVPIAGIFSTHTSSAYGQRVRKRQPDGGSIRIGRIASQRWIVDAIVRVHAEPRAEQRPGVGMLGAGVDGVDGADLDHLAQIHH